MHSQVLRKEGIRLIIHRIASICVAMSASACSMAWNFTMGLLNCWRVFANSVHSFTMVAASPRQLAAIVYLALNGLGERGPWRWMCWAVLFLVIGKLGWEWSTGRAMFVTPANESAVVVPLSHALGIASALLVRVGIGGNAAAPLGQV